MWSLILNIAVNGFTVLGGFVMLFQGYRFVLEKRKYRKKILSLTDLRMQNNEYVINLSGHPITEHSRSVDHWLKDKKIYTIPVHVNEGQAIRNSEDVIKAAEEALASIPKEIKQHIMRGAAVVFALPGMTSLAIALLVKIHGLQGVFPMYTFSLRDEEAKEFVWQVPMDLHKLRSDERHHRFSMDFHDDPT
ncbi:CRISPR-associated protein Csx15 [Sulfoacidibacillus thermotolerans]|uniref:SMODS-associated and fused to various effectors domain-containing protein n=1 Tax=Sulfoacidibacillus thermotolerans TaxID=1765684 RepID=A0A2U3D8G3_SULT2|nr:CRISPR-associated protein Csx15 [Sulfoacidibacillus thermotolerans]PWI57567.1 hypothetical protein BM613_08075 [Sulfoacidibacillus thermotolerans]